MNGDERQTESAFQTAEKESLLQTRVFLHEFSFPKAIFWDNWRVIEITNYVRFFRGTVSSGLTDLTHVPLGTIALLSPACAE